VITLQPQTLLAEGRKLTEVIGHGEQVSLRTPAQEIRPIVLYLMAWRRVAGRRRAGLGDLCGRLARRRSLW